MTSPKAYYDAEHEVEFILQNGGTAEVYGSYLTVPPLRKFGDLDGVRRYVETVCAVFDFKPVPAVARRHGDKAATYQLSTHTIKIPDHRGSRHSWAMNELVVLHELAHAMTRGHGHDARFCSKLVQLVDRVIGPEAGLLLSIAYGERGITITK